MTTPTNSKHPIVNEDFVRVTRSKAANVMGIQSTPKNYTFESPKPKRSRKKNRTNSSDTIVKTPRRKAKAKLDDEVVVTPKSSPPLLNLTPHRSKKTPKQSPIGLSSSPKSAPPLQISRTPRKLTVTVHIPASNDQLDPELTLTVCLPRSERKYSNSPSIEMIRNSKRTLTTSTPIEYISINNISKNSSHSHKEHHSPSNPIRFSKTPKIVIKSPKSNSKSSSSKKHTPTPKILFKKKLSFEDDEMKEDRISELKKLAASQFNDLKVVITKLSLNTNTMVAESSGFISTSQTHSNSNYKTCSPVRDLKIPIKENYTNLSQTNSLLVEKATRSTPPSISFTPQKLIIRSTDYSPPSILRNSNNRKPHKSTESIATNQNELIDNSALANSHSTTNYSNTPKKHVTFDKEAHLIHEDANEKYENTTYEVLEPKTPDFRKRKNQRLSTESTHESLSKMSKVRFDTSVDTMDDVSFNEMKIQKTNPPLIQMNSEMENRSNHTSHSRNSRFGNKVDRRSTLLHVKRISHAFTNSNRYKSNNASNIPVRRRQSKLHRSNETKSAIKTKTKHKMPNFAEIHAKQFSQMESVADGQKRVLKRHAILTESPTKRHKPILATTALNGPYNRFGYNVRKVKTTEAINMIAKKPQTPSKTATETNRNILKGVRMNRRFQLQLGAKK